MLLSIRKNLFTLLLSAIVFQFSFSQGCVIDTNNYQLIFPSSNDLPCVERNVPYGTTIQFFCPPVLAGITIDSILVTNFANLPLGINYTLNPLPCKLYPYTRGCVYLSGTATDTLGTYDIVYNGYVYTSQGGTSFSYLRANFGGLLPEYSLNVVDSGACNVAPNSINDISSKSETDFSVYPNPTSGVLELKIKSGTYSHATIYITDAIGRKVYSLKTSDFISDKTTIDLSPYPKGLYFVQLQNSQGSVSKKISVE